MVAGESNAAAELDAELERLRREREALLAKCFEYFESLRTWQLQVGKFKVSRIVSSQTVAKSFAGWHVTTFTSGVGLTFLSSTRELGIALVVGSLFAIGSFLSQWWSQVLESERYYMQQMELDDDVTRLKEALTRIKTLDAEIVRRNGDQRDHYDSVR